MEWVDLSCDMDKWRISSLPEKVLASQGGLCFTESGLVSCTYMFIYNVLIHIYFYGDR